MSSTSEAESPAMASSAMSSAGFAAMARASSSLRMSTWVRPPDIASAFACEAHLLEDVHRLAGDWGRASRAFALGVEQRHAQVVEHASCSRRAAGIWKLRASPGGRA